jgi:hypothetical protein
MRPSIGAQGKQFPRSAARTRNGTRPGNKQSAFCKSEDEWRGRPRSSPAEIRDRSAALDGSSEMVNELHDALAGVEDLAVVGPDRNRLWIALWRGVATRHPVEAIARGSTARVRVSSEHASAELIAAWEWLIANESQARAMNPVQLRRTLRSVATTSHRGSARAAMADALCGITHVPANVRVEVCGGDALDGAAS